MNLSFEVFPLTYLSALEARGPSFLGAVMNDMSAPGRAEAQAWWEVAGTGSLVSKDMDFEVGLSLHPGSAATCLVWSKLLALSVIHWSPLWRHTVG